MQRKPILVQIRSRSHERWRAVPIFGPLLDDFLGWLHAQGYAKGSISNLLEGIPRVVKWLKHHEITKLSHLTQQDLRVAHDYYRRKNEKARWGVHALGQFLHSRQLVSPGKAPAPSRVEVEVADFEHYLREIRGLATATIIRHASHLRTFLAFLRFNEDPGRWQRLQIRQVEAFLSRAGRTNNRFSLQQIVATIRCFLRRLHTQGLLARPLHQQIDTPRVYRGERFPRAIPWAQVQALLQSIDCSEPFGRRDFTLLYLASAYGLRSGELVRLTLDDVDWRRRTLRIMQTKTRQPLQLPLTEEAANVLIEYLKKARPHSVYRQLFFRMRAPVVPLQPASVHDVLEHRIRCSGLKLPAFGTHVLRHSFATRLMRQGVSIKAIGDALGHRDVESTSIYLRLNLEDLREAALPLPTPSSVPAIKLVAMHNLPRIRPARPSLNLPSHFQSRFASSLRRFVDLKRALGRTYKAEATILRHWDHFIHRHYPQARQVHAEMFTQWTKTLVDRTSTGSRSFQRIVRNFLVFHARDHARTHIPDRLVFPKPAQVISPRLISEAEMGRVLAAAGQLPPSSDNPLRAETIRIGLILLFCCGLRRGELVRLTLKDIQEEQTFCTFAIPNSASRVFCRWHLRLLWN